MTSNHNLDENVRVTFSVKKHLLDAFDQVAERTQISRAALLRMSMAEAVKEDAAGDEKLTHQLCQPTDSL